MNTTTISVGSVTQAQKLRRLLARQRIQTKLIKLDAARSAGGCTHGLEYASADHYTVVMELEKAGIKYVIYRD